MANAIRSNGERNPIRRRTESNQTANTVRPQTSTNNPDTQHSDTPIPPLNMYQDMMKGLYVHLSSWHIDP